MVTYNMDNAQDLGGIDLFVNNLYTGVTTSGQVTAKNIPGSQITQSASFTGATANLNSTGVQGISGQFYIANAPTAVLAQQAVLRVDRNAQYSGGTAGTVANDIWAFHTVGPSVVNYEWSILGQLSNSATAGQNVAGYFQGTKATTAAGPTWGAVVQVVENVNGSTSSTVALELDLNAAGTSNSANRTVLSILPQPITGSTSNPTVNNGILFGTSCIYSTGINLSGATCSVAGIDLGTNSLALNHTTNINGSFSSGSATPALTANKPGPSTSIGAWLSVMINGSQFWIPAWSN